MSEPSRIKTSAGLAAVALALTAGVIVGQAMGSGSADRSETTASAAESVAHDPKEGPKRYRIPVSDSQPSQGPADALVTIVQWCDLPSAGCQAIEPGLQAVLKRHPNDVRLVFRHYVRPAKDSSALAHKFARAVFLRGGNFWEARRLLMGHQGEVTLAVLERYASQLHVDWPAVRATMDDSQQTGHITADRLFGEMFDVRDEPAFFVNGRALPGTPSENGLESLVVEELGHARKLVASGVPRASVYAELTKNGAWNPPVAAAR